MLPESYIESVKDAADIVTVIGRYTSLKKEGANYKGLSQFSKEKTPSMVVSPSKQIFKDFSSGKGGNVFTFIMEAENCGFREAVFQLGDMFSIPRPEESEKEKQENEKRKSGLEMLMEAHSIYTAAWAELPNDHWAKLDLEKRNLSGDSIDWQLCFAPAGKTLVSQFSSSGKLKPLEEAGLVSEKNAGKPDAYYTDFFYNRLLIPIHNVSGQLVGFGGRAEGDQQPKYLNPKESTIYQKSRILFGLDKAKKTITEKGYAILTEGYFDVIALHSKGINNAVASCGTGFAQGKLLKKYTNRAVIMYDGDKAGLKATERAIKECLANLIIPEVCMLPDELDPCDFCADKEPEEIEQYIAANREDGIKYLVKKWAEAAGNDTAAKADVSDKFLDLLFYFKSEVLQEQYISDISKDVKFMNKTSLLRALKARKVEFSNSDESENDERLPEWVDKEKLYTDGFVQNSENRKKYSVGIYFNDDYGLQRITNFTLKPLFHIPDERNNRRLVEVHNGLKHAYVEMPSRAFISLEAFETALIEKGHFITSEYFKKPHFKRIIGSISAAMPIAHEITSLGWQPEGFFSWANRAVHKEQVYEFDEIGIVNIENQNFFSPGVSKIYSDQRGADNIYENDLYLRYCAGTANFETWARQFRRVYSDNAPLGIAFVFITIFKDIITQSGKCPILYGYGPKGSGKSDFAESLTWLFFSGKDSEGKLIRAYNLNPGQGTPFSFFSRLERFTNCPALFNEFDENTIEDFKFGAFKASYDGEGREVGDGESGKRRRTKIQKVRGTLIVVGQYMSVKDDGSVLSRSLTCEFTSSRVDNLTEDDRAEWRKLKEMEDGGLSQIIIELLGHRQHFAKNFAETYWATVTQFQNEFRKMKLNIEQRILRNYALAYSVLLVMKERVNLPFGIEEFYEYCKRIIINHNSKLKENNLLAEFWNTVEYLFIKNVLNPDYDLRIEVKSQVNIKTDEGNNIKEFGAPKTLLFLRMQTVYPQFAQSIRTQGKKAVHTQDTIRNYMKDQSYYIGLCPAVSFKDSSTSAIVIDADELGLNFLKEASPLKSKVMNNEDDGEDLPF